ncbi:MAG: phosphodiester glycosidase family protein [Oscillospiraceae bacterium]|nr:phosphodiester glycosidase family protein [Oscillospiraceae bacterium]
MFAKVIAIILLAVAGTAIAGWLFIKKKLPVWATAAFLVFLYTSVVLCFLLPPARAFLNIPNGDPEDTVSYYCDAVSEGSFVLAAGKVRNSEFSLLEEHCNDPVAEKLLETLLSGIRMAAEGEAEVDWLTASQYVSMSFPNIYNVFEPAQELAVSGMEAAGGVRARSLIYNDDKTYKSSVAQEFFDPAVISCAGGELGIVQARFRLTLVCEHGAWKIQSDKLLYDALMKALAYSDGRSVPEMLDAKVKDERENARLAARYVQKHYVIDFAQTVGPEPDRSRFGVTTDPWEVQRVVDQAAALLDGQAMCWNPDIVIYPGSEIHYYFDDTILAIVWREERNGSCATFAEVKVQDASQLRRKLVTDSFNPPTYLWEEATPISTEVNAVVCTGGDLYAFRNHGIISYGGQLFRVNSNAVDSCFITSSGDMMFSYRYQLNDWASAQQFIDDNDIMFSMAFGPVLIENGVVNYVYDYPIGEIWDEYARSAMGQIDKLHYLMLVMNLDNSLGATRNARLDEVRDAMWEKGCRQAYALDGGQTAVVLIDNQRITQVTPYGWERIYSDMLYFATALTPEERLG